MVTGEQSNLIINQVTIGILSLIDNLEKKYPETYKVETKSVGTLSVFNDKVAMILGKNANIQDKNFEQIQHLVKLYEIHKITLQSSEEAVAKWGELAPSIILHKLTESRQKIEELKKQIEALI